MAAAGPAGLQGLLYLPPTPGKHPLVVMTHATLKFERENREMGPGTLQPEALWFVRRGWAVAIVMRRGYGSSGGKWDEYHFRCGEADLEAWGDEDAADLKAAFEYLVLRPDIDGSQVIAAGDSSGGTAVVSFALHAPPGLKAVVSIAGLWPTLLLSPSACKSHTATSFGDLSADTHVPMLWIYAKNDHLIGPKAATRIYGNFIAAGGNAELSMLERSADDGHFTFSDSPELWGPIVEQFLAKHDLPFVPLYPAPIASNLKLPPGFSDDAQKAFARFQLLGPHKAFAIGPRGEWGYSSGKLTLKLAEQDALSSCQGGDWCTVFAKDAQ
ncbi:MAG: CocE/NonD family hydrolase [Terracidiphilus sp.]